MTTLKEKIQIIQRHFGADPDGKFGDKTADAIIATLPATPAVSVSQDPRPWNSGKASSFADPADIRAFRRCKAQGKSDQQCFKVGDNGIGKWGDDTTGAMPMCALPPDDWEAVAKPRGKLVIVRANGKEVVCELRDTMPRKKNVKNGAMIDLNPAAVAALGMKPPIMVNAEWRWA